MGALEELARELYQVKQDQKQINRPRLAFSSLQPEGDAEANIPEYDVDGNLKSIIGTQFDGGHGVLVTSDPTPFQPSAPIVTAGPGSLTANWDGLWCDADGNVDETIPTPTYHSRVEVHASKDPAFLPITAATLRGSIESPRGGDCVISPLDEGPWYVKLVARSLSGNAGPASEGVFGEPAPLLDEAALDNAVQTRLSASGLVQVTFNDVEPPAPADGWNPGAIWYQTEGPGPDGDTVAWWTWDGTAEAWIPKEMSEAFLPQVNIGTGTFGNLSGDRIVLGTVDPKALSFGTDELLPNPKFMQAGVETVYGPAKVYTNDANTTLNAAGWGWDTTPANLRFGQPHVLKIDGPAAASAGWQHMPIGPEIPVQGGDKFYLQFDTFTDAAANFYASILFVPFDAAGNRITGSVVHTTSNTTTDPDNAWTTHSIVVTMPAGAVSAQPWIEKQNNASAAGYVLVGATSIRRAMAGKSDTGQEMELSPKGIRLFDQDGAEVVSLTSDPPNYLDLRDAAGDSMASLGRVETGEGTGVYEGMVSGDNLSIENDPELMGVRLFGNTSPANFATDYDAAGFLDYLPRGVVTRGYRDMTSLGVVNQEREIVELSYDHAADRAYRITILPFSVYVNDNSYAYINIYRTIDGSRPTMSSTLFLRKTVRNQSGGTIMTDLGGTFYDFATDTGRAKYLFTLESPGTATVFGSATGGAFRVWVEDMGMKIPETGIDRTGLRSTGGSAPAPPATEEKQNYTQTWTATGYRSFYTSGGTYTYNTSKMYQGLSPAVGGLQSMAIFGNGSKGQSITTALSGATVTSIKAYFYFDFWYYNAGGTAKIGVHGSSSLTSSLPGSYSHAVTSSSWPKPGGRWVSIPSSFWAGFKSGTYRGLTLGDTSPTTTEYGYAAGSKTKLEIKYTK